MICTAGNWISFRLGLWPAPGRDVANLACSTSRWRFSSYRLSLRRERDEDGSEDEDEDGEKEVEQDSEFGASEGRLQDSREEERVRKSSKKEQVSAESLINTLCSNDEAWSWPCRWERQLKVQEKNYKITYCSHLMCRSQARTHTHING